MRTVKKIAIIGVGFMGGSLSLTLAKKFPKVKLIVIGASRDKKWEKNLRDTYSNVPNLELMGFVENISIQPPISEDRRKEYASILMELLKISSDSSLKLKIGQKLMFLLLNPNPNLQNLAIEKLPMIFNFSLDTILLD